MMHADNVKESQLREMLEAVSVQMQTSRAAHDATYRPGVGIVLLSGRPAHSSPGSLVSRMRRWPRRRLVPM
jgi:hypothetical protein